MGIQYWSCRALTRQGTPCQSLFSSAPNSDVCYAHSARYSFPTPDSRKRKRKNRYLPRGVSRDNSGKYRVRVVVEGRYQTVGVFPATDTGRMAAVARVFEVQEQEIQRRVMAAAPNA